MYIYICINKYIYAYIYFPPGECRSSRRLISAGRVSPFEWGRRDCGGLSSILGVARCGRSAGCCCACCGPCRLLCWEGAVGVSISSWPLHDIVITNIVWCMAYQR